MYVYLMIQGYISILKTLCLREKGLPVFCYVSPSNTRVLRKDEKQQK